MKLVRNTIILSVILVVLAGTLILLSVFDKEVVDNTITTETTTSEDLNILSIKKDDMAQVTIENKDVKYILSHNNDKYEVTYPAGMKYDSILVNGTFDRISGLTANKVFEETSGDLSKYGLDKPSTVTVKMKDGTTKTIEMGNETTTKDGVYLRLKDSNKIYILSINIAASLKVDKVYYKERRLFAPKKEDLYEIKMDKDGAPVYTVNKYNDTNWTISTPVSGNINADKMEILLNYFSSFTAMSYVDDSSPDLSVYGLDKPSYVFEVKSKTGNMKLLLGKEKSKDTEIYAKIEGNDDIFVVTLTSLNFLDLPLSDLLDRFVCSPDIKSVSDITVTMDGKTTNFALKLDPSDDKDKDKFTMDGKDTSGKDENGEFYFRNYYKSLISLMFTDLDVNAKPTGTPEVTILYHLNKAPGTVKVELIPRNIDSYYAMLDGKYTGKIVFKRDFDDPEGIRECYKKLVELVNKK